MAEVERRLLAQSARDARFLTARQRAREQTMALPPHLRRGGARLRFLPDGAPELRTGECVAIEVELTDKAARVGDKLRWYRDDAGYAEVVWFVPGPGVAAPLAETIDRARCGELMAIERLPAGALRYAGG